VDVLIVFGEGGHAEQMRRLLRIIEVSRSRCVALVDREGLSEGIAEEEIAVSPVREKYGWSSVRVLSSLIHLARATLRISHRHRIRTVLSTGPGICIIPALIFRLLGRKVIHVETWSRFESRSFTGRFMYRLANRFYVQNRSLLRLYPNAKYSGRL